MTAVLSINIGINPNLGTIAGALISWHGVFTAVGILVGVWLAVRLAESPRVNIDPDTAYWIGMLVVFAGIIGARALYVMENYGDSTSIDSPGDIIFNITEGGISIYGAIIGGALAGWIYGLVKRLHSAAGADAAVFGMLAGLAIGRIGDIINGEHFAKSTDLPWGVTYSNPNSPGFEHSIVYGPTHPAVAYELIGDLVILGILAFLWRLNPKSGVIFCTGFVLYAIMRFFVSMLRLDSETPALGLTTPELVSLLVIIVGVPLLGFFLRRPRQENDAMTPQDRARLSISRAERRRRLRA
jgi:phosphatidylglycerol:prolipoprotein diacylglycerol transferase